MKIFSFEIKNCIFNISFISTMFIEFSIYEKNNFTLSISYLQYFSSEQIILFFCFHDSKLVYEINPLKKIPLYAIFIVSICNDA